MALLSMCGEKCCKRMRLLFRHGLAADLVPDDRLQRHGERVVIRIQIYGLEYSLVGRLLFISPHLPNLAALGQKRRLYIQILKYLYQNKDMHGFVETAQ